MWKPASDRDRHRKTLKKPPPDFHIKKCPVLVQSAGEPFDGILLIEPSVLNDFTLLNLYTNKYMTQGERITVSFGGNIIFNASTICSENSQDTFSLRRLTYRNQILVRLDSSELYVIQKFIKSIYYSES